MAEFFSPELLASFFTLTMLEIVLGIDNLIFITLVADKLPDEYRRKARTLGLGLALGIRIVMLMGVTWLMGLTRPLLTVAGMEFSFKDLLMLGGGAFLIGKTTLEMHADISGASHQRDVKVKTGFGGAVAQIVLIDLVFSFDSILTAVGLTQNLAAIVAAVVLAMGVMLLAAGYTSRFLEENPTFKVLALSFILMVGVLLMAEGMHVHLPRGYLYAAFCFSIFVEFINTLIRKKTGRK